MTAVATSSTLLFIDSDNGGSTISPDGEFSVHLPTNSFNLDMNQFARITLLDFHSYKNFYNINSTNNAIMISGNNGVNFEEVRLNPRNYELYSDIATEFLNRLLASTLFSGFTGLVSSTPGGLPSSTGNRIFQITLTKATAHGLTTVVQCRDFTDISVRGGTFSRDHSDSYAILGGKRILVPNNTSQSFNITQTATTVVITGFYPMQRSTIEHVYLRSDLTNANFSTRSFDSSAVNHDINMTSSDIFGKMAVQNEFISFTELNGGSYFCDVFRNNLGIMKFRLTDHKRRNIPEVDNDQDTLGNSNFTMTLRLEIYTYPTSKNILGSLETVDVKKTDMNMLQRRRIPF